jgi:crotonobetainyl-CoA:carnitine CoA-transferase CaiB-like acyl-CoA transferase
MLLADLGAEVLKIEDPEEGDPTRRLGSPFREGESGYFVSINGNKRSVALELRKQEGRQVLYDLAKVSDVVFKDFRPGTVEKLGCNYHTLKEINSQIIYCSLTGFGESGPYRDRPASDLAIPVGELSGSLFSASAISAALYARQQTGAGSRIDIALMDCMLSLVTYAGWYHLINGKVPGPIGSTHQSVVQYQTSATPDVYIVGAVLVDKFWRAFRQVLGVEEMSDDPRFSDNEGRREHREELSPILVDIFRTKAGDE